MVEETIHKLIVSEEAKFDYANLFGLLVGEFGNDLPPDFQLPYKIQEETETYITNHRKLTAKHYLRLTYIIDELDVSLMLFIIKRHKEDTTQYWELVGICYEEDWNEELEECGEMRNWYNSKIKDIPTERDWVLVVTTHKILDKLEEIRDIGEYEDYIEARETIARQLSKPQIDGGGISEVEPGRIKHFLKKRYYNSDTAIKIIRQLDIIINRCGTRVCE